MGKSRVLLPVKNSVNKILFLSFSVAVFFFISCKSTDKKGGNESLATKADSVYQEVINDHNEGMSGWMKIGGKQKQIKRILDSITALPSAKMTAASQYKTKLEEVTDHLKTAYDQMDKWMNELNLDSAKDNPEQKIRYFSGEKLKIETINTAISKSLKEADSLLKFKF